MNMDWLNLPIAEIAFALGGVIGIVGGLCLSQSAILGKDGLRHPCYRYSVHT